jgi:UDP-N-acetylglucosamine 2-epimerase (non-hydrolysing)
VTPPARVAVAFGTRPEASKMAPVVRALAARDDLRPWLLVSGQHRDQLDAMMRLFELRADADLGVMTERQTLPELMARIVPAAAAALRSARPDLCLVHGDTSTTFAVALAAFYEGVPVGHVEAGLRSFDLSQPFPEEANRRLTDALTVLDLAPTPRARANLLREGKPPDGVVVTGNTAVDAIRWVVERRAASARPGAPRRVAITLHRRENLPAMADLARALADAARAQPAWEFVWPLHPNPAVREAVRPALRAAANLRAVEPLPYAEMAELLAGSELIVTDSGGLQEEGAALGVPVLVVRNVTERPEGVEAGVVRLVGTDPAGVGAAVAGALADPAERAAMRDRPNPYGDGRAGARVAAAVAWRLGLGPRPEDWRPAVEASPAGRGADAD